MISWYKRALKIDLEDPMAAWADDWEPEEATPKDGKPWVEVDSSFIDAVAFYPIAEVLEVRMQNGKVFTLMGIPKGIYESFLKAPSKGRYFNKIILPNFSSRRGT